MYEKEKTKICLQNYYPHYAAVGIQSLLARGWRDSSWHTRNKDGVTVHDVSFSSRHWFSIQPGACIPLGADIGALWARSQKGWSCLLKGFGGKVEWVGLWGETEWLGKACRGLGCRGQGVSVLWEGARSTMELEIYRPQQEPRCRKGARGEES